MQDQHKTNQEIVDELNNKSLDEIIEDNDKYDKQYQQAEIEHGKTRLPLYVIVGAAFLIGTINGIYIHSGAVFIMCLVFGGGSLLYLYLTRNNVYKQPEKSTHRNDHRDNDNE